MAEHKQGSMDIRTQEKTFDGFMWFVSRGAALIVVVLILLALLNA